MQRVNYLSWTDKIKSLQFSFLYFGLVALEGWSTFTGNFIENHVLEHRINCIDDKLVCKSQ